ncbi:MAG TPA: hypothetical protein VHM70_19400 [Polyangiaceae bacterium]|nr:hypothetical protein [Polyangiaceae bacterium]
MDELRKPPFVLASIATVLVVAIELGAAWLPKAARSAAQLEAAARALGPSLGSERASAFAVKAAESEQHGLAVPALALFDVLLLCTILLLGASLLVSPRVMGRIQAPIRLVAALLVLVGSLEALLHAIAMAYFMLGLFLAPLFGTLAYLALWGFFATEATTGLLTLVTLIKIAVPIGLLLSHQAFLKVKMVVAMILTSLVLSVVVSLVLGLVPGIVASIADTIAAIVIALVTLIFSLIVFVGSIIPTLKSLRAERESS